MRFGLFLGLLAFVSVSIASLSIASGQTVSFTLNTSSTAPISPFIYGVNGDLTGAYSNNTLLRSGGNRLTAYNWENNASNAGSDYFYQNDNAMGSTTTPGSAVIGMLNTTTTKNAAAVVTIPMVDYVAADKGPGGNVWLNNGVYDPNYLTTRFKQNLPAKGSAFTLTPNTSDAYVYQDEFVNWLKTTYPTTVTNPNTPVFFDLDNEVDLWSSTHLEVHGNPAVHPNGAPTPVPITYAELISKSIAYSTAIKNVMPTSKVFGPVNYGFLGMWNLQNASDQSIAGGKHFFEYYLQQMKAASDSAGQRLLDAYDFHWYPESYANGHRITEDVDDPILNAERIAATRSLWDPTFTDPGNTNNWVNQTAGGPIQIIPRMQSAINTYYPGTKIAISEYDYGGAHNISGGIAQADVLGIFGKQGVDAAAEWPLASNESSSFIGGAFMMYRNYDGKGGTFGDISVATTNSSAANASIYASEYSTDSSRMTLVAINKTTGNLTAQLPLPNAPNGSAFTIALIYKLTAASSTPQFADEVFINNPANFSYMMPGYSVSTIALTSGSASVWTAAASGNWSSTGNWTGGLPNAIGAIAAINASTASVRTITLDAPQTVGTLFLGNSGGGSVGYTLSGTGGNTLTMNNSGNGAVIAVSDGTHAINAPVNLADNLQVCGGNAEWTLSFGAAGIISGGYALTMNGNGTLILSGQNTYTGMTTLTSGVLNLNAAENAGASGPLGRSAAVNHGSIVFNGGTLQYSAVNQYDYSGRFSTAANQAYNVDTNGQNVTWATALTSAGGSLAKLGNGTLSLTAPATNLASASVAGGGVAIGGGTISTFNLNSGAGTSTISAGSVTTINVNAGGVAISGGAIGACNFNTSPGSSTISAGNVTTINVNAGGVAISGGAIGAFNHNTGAGVSTIGAGAAVSAINVKSGTVKFNSTQANGTLALPTGSTGTVIVGPATGGLLPKVATADFSSTPATATVNAANPLAITSTLKLPSGLSATISNGASFTATGANLADTSTPSTLGLSGGTLTFPTGAVSQTIGVHWAGYGNNTTTPVTGTDGVVPQSHWTNVAANWYSGSASNLVNGSGTATTVAVTAAGNGAGTYWSSPSPAAGVDNLVWGPGGGNGAIMNAITGIPYFNYEIIAYLNDYQAAGSQFTVWLDGNAASSNQSNAPLAGSRYYYGATNTNPVGFVQMTNNSNANTYNNANYVIWTGLSGSSQTLWTQGWSSGGASGNSNEGITGFQIVSTAEPANVNLPATAVSVTSSSTLDVGEPGTPTQYHTLGGLSLTAGTAGGTQLQLQHGSNINFKGISAAYPTGGTGTKTASIVNGSTSPVISLAGGSSVSVDPNVTLTIASTIGDPQTGATALTKLGSGTLILTGANTYSGGTTVLGGTLKFNIISGAATIAAGATATVTSGATLELAGSVSALGSAGGNRVHIVNNSTASGIIVSGMNQVVGGIDGPGNTQVNAGSRLLADHIIQGALVIGGAASNPGLVMIDASDVQGNSLEQTSGFALAESLTPSGPFSEGVNNSTNLSSTVAHSTDLAPLSVDDSAVIGNAAPVPEPSTLMLALLVVLSVVGARFVRHHFRRQPF